MPAVNFEPIKEEWTIIELEDKTTIRMRPVLLYLRRGAVSKKRKIARGAIRIGLQFGVGGKRKGKPSNQPITPDLVRKHITKTNLRFRFLQRGESTYRTDIGNLTVKATPIRFDKTDLFDQDGEPVYSVNHELLVLPSV